MNFKSGIGLLLCLPILIMMGAYIYSGIVFDIDIGGHMKRAADANTIEMATEEMRIVVDQIETKGYTTGYTSIIYRTPDEDVGFWYRNMNSSLSELESVPVTATPLERSNILMKLRETLLDSGQNGDDITTPPGIPRYPDNKWYATLGWMSLITLIFGIYLYDKGRTEEQYITSRHRKHAFD